MGIPKRHQEDRLRDAQLREYAAELARITDPAERLLWYVKLPAELTMVDFDEIERCLADLGWLDHSSTR